MKKFGFILAAALCVSLCSTGVFAAEKTSAPNKQEQVQTQDKQPVFITTSGKKYHASKTCSTLKNSKNITQLAMKDAQQKKLTPCKICYPDKKM